MIEERDSRDNVICQELIDGVPTASRRVVERYYFPLYIQLHKQFPFMPTEAVEDAAHDALLALINFPQRYDSSRSNLLTYLCRIAHHKIVDLIKATKRTKLEIYVGGTVALEQEEENNYRTGQHSHSLSSGDESETLPPDIIQLLEKILPNPADRQIWDMICEGRQDISDYAQLLGITHLSLAEQKAEVKRHRERVGKRVRRHQDEFHKRLFGEEL